MPRGWGAAVGFVWLLSWSWLGFVLRRLLGHPCGYKSPRAFLEGCFGQCSGEVRGFFLSSSAGTPIVLHHGARLSSGSCLYCSLVPRLGVWSTTQTQGSESLSKHIFVLVLKGPSQALTLELLWLISGRAEVMVCCRTGLLRGFGASAGLWLVRVTPPRQ